jgi:ParB-like chromosome segregation protein Spo0J
LQMADKIVMRPVEALIPYARNARTHSEEQVAQIAGSIREFGFTNPVLVDGERRASSACRRCRAQAALAWRRSD